MGAVSNFVGSLLGAHAAVAQAVAAPQAAVAAPATPAAQAATAASGATKPAAVTGAGDANTLLTGLGGVDSKNLSLGKNTLLGE